MDKNMSANIAGVAGALAMMGVTLASRSLGFTAGDTLQEDAAAAALSAVNKEGEASEGQEEALGMGVHLGFSMSSAILYSRLRKYVSLPGPLAGGLFGLALWGANVAGAAPMLGIRQVPWKQSEARAITTILSHVLFGVVVGLLFDELSPPESNTAS